MIAGGVPLLRGNILALDDRNYDSKYQSGFVGFNLKVSGLLTPTPLEQGGFW